MPVTDDGHPLPYQDHQRCNNGTTLTKEKTHRGPLKWFTASMLSASFSLSLSLSLFLSLSLSLSLFLYSTRNTPFILYRLCPFRDCRSNLRTLNLNWTGECVAVNAIAQECRLLPLIYGYERGAPPAPPSCCRFSTSFQLPFRTLRFVSILLWSQHR